MVKRRLRNPYWDSWLERASSTRGLITPILTRVRGTSRWSKKGKDHIFPCSPYQVFGLYCQIKNFSMLLLLHLQMFLHRNVESIFFKTANLFVSIIFSSSEFCKLIKCFIKKLFVPCWLLGIWCFSVVLSAPFLSQIMYQANWSCLSRGCLGRKVQEELLVFYKSQESLCCSSPFQPE